MDQWKKITDEQTGDVLMGGTLSGLPSRPLEKPPIPEEPTVENAEVMLQRIDPGIEDVLDPIYPLKEVKDALKHELKKGRQPMKAVAQIIALYKLGVAIRIAGLSNGGANSGRKVEITMGGLDMPTPEEDRGSRGRGSPGAAAGS